MLYQIELVIFAILYIGIPIAERMGLNGGNPFLSGLCTLVDP